MPQAIDTTDTMTSVHHLPLDTVSPESNDRHTFDEAPLQELATSIAQHGLAQPITVRPRTDGEAGWWIVAGERRWRAHQIIGADTIRALVIDADDEHAAAVMLLENLNRVDLNPMEEAHAYRTRIDRFGYTVEQLATTTGKTVGVVRARLALLDLDPVVQDMVRTGIMWIAGAAELAGLDANRQRLAANTYYNSGRCVRTRMNGPEWDALVRRLRSEQAEEAQQSLLDPDDFLVQEEYLLNARRSVRPNGSKMAALLAAALDHVPADHPDRAAMTAAIDAWS